MHTKKPTRTGRPSRATTRDRSTATRQPATNVVHLHEHLTVKGQGASLRCQRLRLMADVAHAVGPHVDRDHLDRAMQVALRAAFPA